MTSIFPSLNQGKQFDQNKNKNTKNKNKNNNLMEGFTDSSDYIPESGTTQRIPVFMNQYKRIQSNQSVSSNDFQQLNNLQDQLNDLNSQYNDVHQSVENEGLAYMDLTSSSNPYLSKNITVDNSAGQLPVVSSGVGGYVTGKGIFKNYIDQTMFNATAGKNGCPAGKTIGVKSDKFSSLLRNGTDMKSGQSCGNEGTNVYVSSMLSNPSTSYKGCSYNTNPTDNTTTSAMTSAPELYTFNECQQYAIDNGKQYFAIRGDPETTGKSTCLVGDDLTTAQQYGDASRLVTKTKLWSTEGLTDVNGQAKSTGQTSVRLNNKGQLVFSNAANEEQTFTLGTGSSGCEVEFSQSIGMDAPGNDLGLHTWDVDNTELCKSSLKYYPTGVGVTMTNDGKNCWTKSKITGLTPNPNLTTYELVREESKSKCKFFMVLQTDGNLCIYKGSDPSHNEGGGALWCSMTNGKQLEFNWDFVATVGGKYGKAFLTTGQTLALNEFIGSDDGKLQLIMDTTGNLVLNTSTIANGCLKKNDTFYGNTNNSNAIYQINEISVPANLGNVAYIDNNAIAHPYSTNMLGYSDNYTIYSNFDSPNDDTNIASSSSGSIDDCKAACNSNIDCAGFVWANDDLGNQCRLKNSTMFPKSPRVPNNNRTMYVRKPTIINNGDMCNKSIVDVDTLRYENYIKGPNMTTDAPFCKDTVISDITKSKLEEIQNKLLTKGQEIGAKIKELYQSDKTIFDKMDVNDVDLKKKILMYKRTVMGNNNNNTNKNGKKLNPEQLPLKEGMQGLDMNDVNGMLADTDIRILQENYSYVLWSVLAVGLLTITVNVMKANKQ